MWGPTGLTRLFNAEFGNMMSWLLPAALVMGAVLLALTIRATRTDRERAALLLWGGALVGTGLTISLAQGIIHPYYAVALAPPLAGLVGIGAVGLWQRRDSWIGRAGLAAALVVTVAWGVALLGRTPTWFPSLRIVLVVAGILGAVVILALPLLKQMPKAATSAAILLGLGAALVTPLFSTVATAATPHTGAIPSVTPTAQGGQGGPGGGFGPGGAGGAARRAFGPGGPPALGGNGTGAQGFGGGGFTPPAGGFGGRGAFPGGVSVPGSVTVHGGGLGGARAFPGGAGGGAGFLNASTSNAALTKDLKANASHYTWAAATVNSNSAAGYQLASDEPVMAIGGFNGTDPSPTLAQFEQYVAQGKIHYFISSGGGFGGGQGSGSDDASKITSWVENHFTATTVGGTTVYNLTSAPKA
jgi:4-amino-4-deoxy-L-arabinose transferase-like glycosyltransferase